MKKHKVLIGLVIIAILIVGAIGFNTIANKNNQQNDQKSTSVRFKWLHQGQFAGFYTAEKNGYYADQNLEVKLDAGGPDISATQMVLSGANDFGVVGADQLVLAREKGIPLVALAVIYQKTPVALASLKETAINSPKDLEGKKVAIVYGKDEEVVYRSLLKKEGVDQSKITETPLTFDLNQLISKQVDAIIVYETNEPILLRQQGVDINVLKPRDYGINYYADTIFTTEKMLKENPDLVKRFLSATLKGWEESFKNKENATEYILAVNPTLNRDHQKQLLEVSEALVVPQNNQIGYSDMAEWKNLQDILIAQGLQKQEVDLSKLFTNEYLQ